MEDASGDTLVDLLVGLADQPLNRLQLVLCFGQSCLEVIQTNEGLKAQGYISP